MKSISVSTRYAKWLVMISGLCLLGACATAPSGPSALVLPGAGKSFDQFRTDDASCREFAYQQIGGAAAQQNAERKAVQSAVVGTTIGAVAGAALGGSRGAGVGAGTGLVVGSAVGSDAANASAYGAQRRYDQAYVQCMYAAGHKVPVSGSVSSRPSYQSSPTPPPPPPPGVPPPPPPGMSR